MEEALLKFLGGSLAQSPPALLVGIFFHYKIRDLQRDFKKDMDEMKDSLKIMSDLVLSVSLHQGRPDK